MMAAVTLAPPTEHQVWDMGQHGIGKAHASFTAGTCYRRLRIISDTRQTFGNWTWPHDTCHPWGENSPAWLQLNGLAFSCRLMEKSLCSGTAFFYIWMLK
jgi:hypothetical protein